MPLDLPGLKRAGAWGMTGIEVDDAGKVVRQVDMVDITEAQLLELVPQYDLAMTQRHEAALQKQIDDAKTASDKVTAEHKAATDKLSDDLATAITERAVAISDKVTAQAQSVTLTTANTALQTQVNEIPALQAKVTSLLNEVNFDPRTISSDAFFSRLTGKELFSLGNSKDATTMEIAALFSAYQDNKWRVQFDSLDYLNPIGYLIAQGVLTEARATEISRDATRAEAYFAP